MAPELLTQAVADPNYVIEMVDNYDAGCILFVMCAGHLPFPDDGELLFQVCRLLFSWFCFLFFFCFQKIAGGHWQAPAHFSENLCSLLKHVMEKDWRRR